jgi:hypothetical protein
VRPQVLDAGFFIALERGDGRALAVADAIRSYRIPAFVPASVVAQVWRGSPRQHDIGVLLKSRAITVETLNDLTARAVGVLLGKSRASDVTDAHVALLARRLNAIVYTSDPGDIEAINPQLQIESI